MGSSFILFDVSMEITQRQLRKAVTHKNIIPYPRENASYPWVKGLSVTTTINTIFTATFVEVISFYNPDSFFFSNGSSRH